MGRQSRPDWKSGRLHCKVVLYEPALKGERCFSLTSASHTETIDIHESAGFHQHKFQIAQIGNGHISAAPPVCLPLLSHTQLVGQVIKEGHSHAVAGTSQATVS